MSFFILKTNIFCHILLLLFFKYKYTGHPSDYPDPVNTVKSTPIYLNS